MYVKDYEEIEARSGKRAHGVSSSTLLNALRLERDRWLKYSYKRKSEGSFDGFNHGQAVADGLSKAIRIVGELIPPNASSEPEPKQPED